MKITTYSNLLTWRTSPPPAYGVLVATEDEVYLAAWTPDGWRLQNGNIVPGVLCWADPVHPQVFIKLLQS